MAHLVSRQTSHLAFREKSIKGFIDNKDLAELNPGLGKCLKAKMNYSYCHCCVPLTPAESNAFVYLERKHLLKPIYAFQNEEQNQV